jgi:hypothetical protein
VHAAWRTSGCNSGNDFVRERLGHAERTLPWSILLLQVCVVVIVTQPMHLTTNDTSVREHAAVNKCTILRGITAGVSRPQAFVLIIWILVSASTYAGFPGSSW